MALLRFYQRTVLRYENFDRQTFGLADEIHPALEECIHEPESGGALLGFQRYGILAPFAFTDEQVNAYANSSLFQYLDAAFTTPTAEATDWQRRFVSSLRALGLAAVLQEQHLRIALIAMAVEVLLGDPVTAHEVMRSLVAGSS